MLTKQLLAQRLNQISRPLQKAPTWQEIKQPRPFNNQPLNSLTNLNSNLLDQVRLRKEQKKGLRMRKLILNLVTANLKMMKKNGRRRGTCWSRK